MKYVVSLLILLLLAGIGAGAYFYINMYQPLEIDYARLKAGMPELDRAKAELKKYRDRESWIKPALETLKAGLADEINGGKAEVVAATNGTVVVDLSEQVLYTPGSRTFAKNSVQTLAKIATLLRNEGVKGKDIIIANITEPVPPQTKGRKRIPGKDARELACERSYELVKYLEKNGVAPESLVAAAYPPKPADRGFKLKDHKTIFVIGYPASPAQGGAAPKPETKPAGPASARPGQPKPIPISPTPPKTN